MPSESLFHDALLAVSLHDAAELASCIQQGIQEGFDFDSIAPEGMTLLTLAASSGFAEGVRLLLPLSDPHAVDRDGHDALMHAAWGGHSACVEQLLPSANPSRRNKKGQTALILAADSRLNGALECVRFLAPISDVEAVDERGECALMKAAQTESDKVAAFLATLCDAKAPRGERWCTPLMAAIQAGHVPTARALLPHSDLSAKNSTAQTAVQIASERRCAELIPLLAEASDWLDTREAFEHALSAAIFVDAQDLLPYLKTVDAFAPFLSEEQALRAVRGLQFLDEKFAQSLPQISSRLEALELRQAIESAANDVQAEPGNAQAAVLRAANRL